MKIVLCGLAFSCALVLNCFISGAVGAVEEWRIGKSEIAAMMGPSYCPTFTQIERVGGYSLLQELCIFGDEKLRVGTFFADGGAPRIAVMSRFDSDFRAVNGVCQGMAGCLYNAEYDRLITKSTAGIKVFDRTLERLHALDRSSVYEFDTNIPEYSLDASVGAIGISRNGKWLVVEIKNKGIDLIDLVAFTRKRLISPGVLYGYGRDPQHELAVSNDGEYVAVMGMNGGFKVVTATPDCVDSCEVVMGNTSGFISSFNFASHPVFDTAGQRLSFFATSFHEGVKRVELFGPLYSQSSLTYLALGDSFTSGEGETEDRFYKAGTNNSSNRCHLSSRAYPFLLSDAMKIPKAHVASVACAGATIKDIVGARDGQYTNRPLALENFLPGNISQSEFVEYYQPAVVTVGIGGNDAGLMGKLKTCAMPDICEWVSDPDLRVGAAKEIQRLFYKLRDMYQRLKEQYDGILYAVGYPHIINPEGLCDPVTTTLFTYAERIFMKQSLTYLNEVIKAAAESTGITYLDIENSLVGRELCSESLQRVINGIRFGDDIAVFASLPAVKIIGNETFHPTPEGHQIIARYITENYGDLQIRRGCTACLDTLSPPPIPPYWGEESSESSFVESGEFLDNTELVSTVPSTYLRLPPGTFESGSVIRVELHSGIRLLGEWTALPDGSAKQELTVPDDTPEGYHSIHVYGTARSLIPIDIYQVISYEHREENNQTLTTHNASISPPGPIVDKGEVLGAVMMGDLMGISQSQDYEVSGNKATQPNCFLNVVTFSLFVLGVGVALLALWKIKTIYSQDRGG